MNHAVASEIGNRRHSTWWPACTGFAAAVAGFLILYWATAASLAGVWAHSGMFQFGFLIFPVSAWLVWEKRHELAAAYRPNICLWALPLLLAATFVWLLGRIANVNVLEHAAFVITFPLLVLVFFGAAVARALAFPLTYLAFAIPVRAIVEWRGEPYGFLFCI